ncbi:MAG: T9SS type A sorting domain-containing protein [Calditrichaeota bacterium]|nr:T9SS type A sorting domain-containing protein [Calditrichota bacterium]
MNNFRRCWHVMVLVIFLLAATFSPVGKLFSQSTAVVIDGRFSDWNSRQPLYTDARGDGGSDGIDFGRLWAGNDNRFLFLSVEMGREIILQNDNNISLFIDTDNNSNTGEKINGIGADLQWNFGQRNGFLNRNGQQQAIFHNDIGLVTAPTVSSNRFELALDWLSEVGGERVFSSDTIRIVFRDAGGDQLPAPGSVVTYIWGENAQPAMPVLSIRRSPSATFRAMAYNVLHDGPFDDTRASSFSRILKAIAPDIIGFEEIYDHSASQVAKQVSSFLPLPNGKQWYASKVDPDVLVVSRYPILKTFPLDGNGAFLLDLRSAGEKELLYIVAHPPCCGKDEQRQREIDHIMAFIRDAKSQGGELTLTPDTPILIVGDMNLVGQAQQLQTFLTGEIVNHSTYGPSFSPDWDGTSLADLDPRHTNWPLAFTWYSPHSSYNPGRLDYMIYTDSVLKPLHQFVLFTPEMNQDSLAVAGLQAADATTASDHLPVVGDFKWVKRTGISEQHSSLLPRSIRLEQNYPNPFNPETVIRVHLPVRERVHLAIYDSLGRLVDRLIDGERDAGSYSVSWNAANQPSGVYFYRIQAGEFTATKKLLLLK